MPRALPLVPLLACLAVSALENPVMPGDHPDPSVIRFAGRYWAAVRTLVATMPGCASAVSFILSPFLMPARFYGIVAK